MKQLFLIVVSAALMLAVQPVKGSGTPDKQRVQGLTYGVAAVPWNQDFGNHRAVIAVKRVADAVRVVIPWRRRDADAGKKRIIVTDEKGTPVKNIYRISVDREVGDFVFQPESRAGRYYVYYMPYTGKNNNGWFSGDYLVPEDTPDRSWVDRNQLGSTGIGVSRLEMATVERMESRTLFDSFYPMEVCATQREVQQLRKDHPESFILFPEDRRYPIRMTKDLPYRWIENQPDVMFSGTAQRNEYYAFQIGVYAATDSLRDVQVAYRNAGFKVTCFNLEGVDPEGKAFTKRVDVPKGEVQPLWFGVDIPANAAPGKHTFFVTVKAKNAAPQTVQVSLKVDGRMIADRGDSEPWRHSRLRWLNSTLGIDDKTVAPFAPLKVDGLKVRSTLHEVRLAPNGFLEGIASKGMPLLERPLELVVETDAGAERLAPRSLRFVTQKQGRVSWVAEAGSANLGVNVHGTMEFDGSITYSVAVKAQADVKVKDIRLDVPMRKAVARYFMGMGLPGQACPSSYRWTWSGPQDSYWIGSVPGGIHCELRGASYSGPLLSLYRPAPPEPWFNANKGGFRITASEGEVLASTFSGERSLKQGDSLRFEYRLLVTPVKELNTRDQFVNRYYHNGDRPTPEVSDLSHGIKLVNVHHANPINPYINYPFIALDSMSRFINRWHAKGLKIKFYYTIRELTNQVPEIWALRSLNNEILAKGSGGGYPWLREHFGDDYVVAWFTPINGYQECDAAVVTSGKSRWYNYYIEGLRWLVKNADIDGLYLDDVAFDRSMLKRMRKVMDSVKPGCVIDLHSNTGFSRGPANQYAEYFPYINKLWFGESFMYDKMSPESWLVEVSGIPFGLMGDMLYRGGNPWRGMVYGMTVRYPWYTEGVSCDPRDIWKVWDSFGIADARMVGYWESNTPVRSDNPDVLVTAYIRKGRTLLSVASWSREATDVALVIDWKALGIDPAKAKLSAPAIPHFQEGKAFSVNDRIAVQPGKGWLIVISE